MAKAFNLKAFKHIKEEAEVATRQLATERGECPDGKWWGAGVRNAHLLAIAPNASSSIICGNTSPSIEPYRANAFTQKTKTGSQAQSVNVFFPADVSKQELHNVHMMAWSRKLKTLYYLRSEAIKRAEVVSDQKLREFVFDYDDDEACLACEG